MRNHQFVLGALLLFLLPAQSALAEQGCADGFVPNPVPSGTPGQNQCVPMPGQNRGGGGYEQAPTRWEKRWGAIAYDSVTGKLGAVTDMTSKRKAVNGALSQCKSKGGQDCKVSLNYYNQCAALAWGEGDGGIFRASSGPDLEEVKTRALANCENSSGGACEIFYTGCSKAELVQN